ncbi:DUF1376 domain-containing protein [Ochrobactrum sp. XJ1]|nr:DUF1376 domain-containing protein [Ochrobactrum sp. XJ1]
MSSTPFMQLYVSDYLGDTMHLTTEQHGAYLLLLMTMWRHGGTLPNAPLKLARIARVTPRRWHLISAEVMEFFDVDGALISQRRLVQEYKKVVSISQKRSASAKRGAQAKLLKNNNAPQAIAEQMPKHSQKPYIDTSSFHSDVSAQPQKKTSVKSELERVLDADHAQAVIDHRNRLRKPLTTHAAKLLAGKLDRCPDANAAADIMIERGWQAIDPQWIENLTASHGHAPPQQPSLADAFRQLTEKLQQQGEYNGGPTIEGSNQHRDFNGSGETILRSDAEKRQRQRLDGILPNCLPQIDQALD